MFATMWTNTQLLFINLTAGIIIKRTDIQVVFFSV